MTVSALLDTLDGLGVKLTVAGGDLEYEAPAGVLTPELRQALHRQKAMVIARLAETDDPRPDLAEDTARWQWLLGLAYQRYGDGPESPCGILHGFRCAGARLERSPGTLRLKPRIDAARQTALWAAEGEWRRDRAQWLMPHAGALKQLLAEACQEPPVQPGRLGVGE